MIQLYLKGVDGRRRNSPQASRTSSLSTPDVLVDESDKAFTTSAASNHQGQQAEEVNAVSTSQSEKEFCHLPIFQTNHQSPFSELWRLFAHTTTGHGFAKMIDPLESWRFKIFWAVAIVLLATVLLITISLISYEALVVRGLQREFIVQQNNTMYLPDIHICDTSLYLTAPSWKVTAYHAALILVTFNTCKHFNVHLSPEMGFNKTMGSYLALTLSPMLASRALKKKIFKRDFEMLMQNRTIQQVFERATLKSQHCCLMIFGNRTYVTDLATMCVSTSKQSPLEEIFASQVYGLIVYLKTNRKHRFEFDSSIVSRNVASRRGLLYAVSDTIIAVNPTISSAGHYMAPGKWAGVSISFTRIDNTELEKGMLSPYSCVPFGSISHLHLVPNYNIYSERNCIFASARIVLERKFNCTIFRFLKTGNIKPCDPDTMIDAYSPNLAQMIKKVCIPQSIAYDGKLH